MYTTAVAVVSIVIVIVVVPKASAGYLELLCQLLVGIYEAKFLNAQKTA
jgi:hypothetical protein